MIAKIIVHGADRAAALRQMSAALAQTEVVGVQTNLALLRAILGHADFAAADFDTGFIGRHPDVLALHHALPQAAIAAATLTVLAQRAAANLVPTDPTSPWGGHTAWRMNLQGGQTVHLRHADRTLAALTVLLDGAAIAFDEIDPLLPPHAEAAGGGKVIAPIPGRLASVLGAPGDSVTAGQVLVVMEAMKMEISLSASRDGTVASVHGAVGDMVGEGTEVVVLEEEG